MKKTILLSLIAVATALTAVGCTSTETAQTSGTAQITTGAGVSVNERQAGVAVQANTLLQTGHSTSVEAAQSSHTNQ